VGTDAVVAVEDDAKVDVDAAVGNAWLEVLEAPLFLGDFGDFRVFGDFGDFDSSSSESELSLEALFGISVVPGPTAPRPAACRFARVTETSMGVGRRS
jgi:hypothetical protein